MEGFKVVIVGGGSSHTPGIIQSLIANLDRFPLKKLVLYDIDPDRLELVDTLCGSLIAKLDPEWRLLHHHGPGKGLHRY